MDWAGLVEFVKKANKLELQTLPSNKPIHCVYNQPKALHHPSPTRTESNVTATCHGPSEGEGSMGNDLTGQHPRSAPAAQDLTFPIPSFGLEPTLGLQCTWPAARCTASRGCRTAAGTCMLADLPKRPAQQLGLACSGGRGQTQGREA
jgi:hypothetical protein